MLSADEIVGKVFHVRWQAEQNTPTVDWEKSVDH